METKPSVKWVADTTIRLPFDLDFCARGPEVAPLNARIGDWDATLHFPPSLGDGTDGKGIFGDWAWWTGHSLRIVLERDAQESDDLEAQRDSALRAANQLLGKFLNAYRVKLNRPDAHTVRIDPGTLSLSLRHPNGETEALPEPFQAFFYQSMPKAAPVERSVSASTLPALQADLNDDAASSPIEHLKLDADRLEAEGKIERADLLRRMIEAWEANERTLSPPPGTGGGKGGGR